VLSDALAWRRSGHAVVLLLVCDPREEYAATFVACMPGFRRLEGTPAVGALSHAGEALMAWLQTRAGPGARFSLWPC
jgi:hypothetical protein